MPAECRAGSGVSFSAMYVPVCAACVPLFAGDVPVFAGFVPRECHGDFVHMGCGSRFQRFNNFSTVVSPLILTFSLLVQRKSNKKKRHSPSMRSAGLRGSWAA